MIGYSALADYNEGRFVLKQVLGSESTLVSVKFRLSKSESTGRNSFQLWKTKSRCSRNVMDSHIFLRRLPSSKHSACCNPVFSEELRELTGVLSEELSG